MRAALWLVGLSGVAVALALLVGSNHSTVSIFWSPYRIDLSLNFALVLLVALFTVLHWAFNAVTAMLNLPQQARRWRAVKKERAMVEALLDAAAQLLTGRYLRSVKAAQKAIDLQQDLQARLDSPHTAPAFGLQLRALAHLIAAESAHALSDRVLREQHRACVSELGITLAQESVQDVVDATRLRAARWALRERSPEQALQWLNQLRGGTARRTLALRLRLKATRLNDQPEVALDTARLLSKHGAFSHSAAQSLLRELALTSLQQTQDASQLERAWGRLDQQERDLVDVALFAVQHLLQLEGDARQALSWITPLWNRLLQQPDGLHQSQRYRLVSVLSLTLSKLPVDQEWLLSIERARVAYPRWPELQFLAGMVCWQHALWGKAQQMLEMSVERLIDPEIQRQAWCTLAQLAQQKEETARAQQCWQRAAQISLGA